MNEQAEYPLLTTEQYADFGKAFAEMVFALHCAGKIAARDEDSDAPSDAAINSYITAWSNQRDELAALRTRLAEAEELGQQRAFACEVLLSAIEHYGSRDLWCCAPGHEHSTGACVRELYLGGTDGWQVAHDAVEFLNAPPAEAKREGGEG